MRCLCPRLLNALELHNDSAMHFGLGLTFKAMGREKGKASLLPDVLAACESAYAEIDGRGYSDCNYNDGGVCEKLQEVVERLRH